VKVGIITSYLGRQDTAALRFALLSVNRILDFIEFEIIYDLPAASELGTMLAKKGSLDRRKIKEVAPSFLYELERTRIRRMVGGSRDTGKCDRFLLITSKRFLDNFYLVYTDSPLRILSVGNWNKAMYPPSLLEFIVSVSIKQGVREAIANPASHHASRGCLFDMNQSLNNTRNGILSGYICSDCEAILDKNNSEKLSQIRSVLGGRWLGDPNDVYSAHSELLRLGFTPFKTSGVKESILGRIASVAGTKIGEEIVKYAVLALALYFGISSGLSSFVGKL
jgi:hypothetical protein